MEYSERELITKSTISLTAYCFKKINADLLEKLESAHPGILNKKVSQIYGFTGYNDQHASLKSELEKMSGAYINGKYLYDKNRELASGKPIIKINKPYNHILFEYLGYDGVMAYVNDRIIDETEIVSQLELLQHKTISDNHYYVSYHFGEYKKIVKSQVTVRDNWKRIEYNYVYPQDDGSIKSFLYYGDIKKRADALHIQTRTYLDGKMVPSGENILYIGYGDPSKSKYILGVFSAFDINNKLIAVKTIHEKCVDKEEMLQKSVDLKIPGYIAQELRNQRIENEIHIPNDKLEISSKSPYYLTYEKAAGTYHFSFESEHVQAAELQLFIDPNSYKITSLIDGILINEDDLEILHNGSIMNISLRLSGLTPFLQLDIYVKTYYLYNGVKATEGKYSGIDFENRLVNGNVTISFDSCY